MPQSQLSNAPLEQIRDTSGAHTDPGQATPRRADLRIPDQGTRHGRESPGYSQEGEIGVRRSSGAERRSTHILNARTIPVISIILEFALLTAASFYASDLYHRYTIGQLPYTELYLIATGTLAGLFCITCGFNRDYSINRLPQRHEQIRSIFLHWNSANLLFSLLLFVTYATDFYSRGALIAQYVFGILSAILVRLALGRFVEVGLKRGFLGGKRVLIVGDRNSVSFVERNLRHRSRNVEVVGAVTLPSIRQTAQMRTGEIDRDVSDSLKAIETIARRTTADEIVLSMPFCETALIRRFVDELAVIPATIHLVPDASASWTHHLPPAQVGALATLRLLGAPLTLRDQILKRCFDLVVGTAMLIFALPVFAIISLLIKLDSSGPVYFRQRRHGFNLDEFRIFKFRTMTTLEDGDRFRQAKRGDKRITRVGKFLRRTNLDELPQLFNVIAGQMSLVGPRPHAVAHNNDFEEKIRLYAKRHNVKPGITGWSQVNGYRGETDTLEKMQKRVEHDAFYIDNWSIRFDIMILILTIFSLKSYRNAY